MAKAKAPKGPTYGNLNSISDGGAVFNAGTTITVNAEGFVYNFYSTLGPNFYDAALLLMNGAYTVTVNGIVGSGVDSEFGRGIEIGAAAGVSKLSIGDSGNVFGVDSAVCLFQPTTLSNSGMLEGQQDGVYAGGAGAWSITNTVDGFIVAADRFGIWIDAPGIHTITNAGAIWTNNENSWAIYATLGGMEKLTNAATGSIGGDVFLGDNADTFVNAGYVTSVDMGTGNDIFTNSGKVGEDVFMGDDNDTFTNSGQVFGSVFMGNGNDVFNNTGTVDGDISLGAGNDTFNGSAARDAITDEIGQDTYNLLGGNDVFYAVGTGSQFNIDTINGGKAGFDLYFGGDDATADLLINIDTVAHFDPIFLVNIAANTATSSEVGIDKIFDFESAFGGLGNDSIFGSAANNSIHGWEGNDNLFGLAGKDSIYGGIGIDDIFGGAGRDTLSGGDEFYPPGHEDGETDVFHYTALSDSGTGKSARDFIITFEDGIDLFDFSVLNTLPGMDLFFIGTNVAFGQTVPGDIRVLTIGSGWLIQIDAGIDGKPDMAIEVQDITHSINWSADDFILV